MIQVKERECLLQICTFCCSLHVQFIQTPTILGISFLSCLIYFTNTTKLENSIKLQWYLPLINPLIKELHSCQLEIEITKPLGRPPTNKCEITRIQTPIAFNTTKELNFNVLTFDQEIKKFLFLAFP